MNTHDAAAAWTIRARRLINTLELRPTTEYLLVHPQDWDEYTEILNIPPTDLKMWNRPVLRTTDIARGDVLLAIQVGTQQRQEQAQ